MIYSGKLQLASGVIGVAAGIILFIAFKKLMRLYQKLKRTGSVSTHIFARRRQGGVK